MKAVRTVSFLACKWIFHLAIAAAILTGGARPMAAQAAVPEQGLQPGESLGSAMAAAELAGWTVECLDCPKRFDGLGERSLALDNQGLAHLAYGGDALYMAHQSAGGWTYETIDPTPGAGLQASLALDLSNLPSLAYHVEDVNEVRLAWRDDSGWQVETVAQGGGVALALDRRGSQRLSWISNQGVMTGVRSANGWQIERLGAAPAEIHTSLGIDGRGRVHLVAGHDYYFESESGWQRVDLSTALGGPVYQVSLALDNLNRLHLAYYDPLAQEIRYALEQEGAWQASIAAAEPLAAGQPGLTLDQFGQPWISFSALPGQADPDTDQIPAQPGSLGFPLPEADVRLARRSASGWTVTSVTGRAIGSAPLAMSASGELRLALLRGSPAATLELAVMAADDWLLSVVDRAGLPGDAAVQVNAAGEVHVSYADRAGNTVQHAVREGSGWRTTSLAPGQDPALALDGSGQPLISFSAAPPDSDVQLTLARYTQAAGWGLETIDPQSAGRGSSLAVDASGNVHISYLDALPDRRIRYAAEGPSGWSLSTAARFDLFLQTAPDLAIRPDGLPQIGYALVGSARQEFPIQLAILDEMGWFLQSTALSAGGALAFAAAADSTPRLAYAPCDFPACERALNYASLTAAGWQTEIVDPEVRTGQADLALDRAGYAHISYHDEANGDLKYAYRDGLDWQVRTLAAAGQVGAQSALALDGGDCPHIVFTDDSRSDLLYARLTGPVLRWVDGAQEASLLPGGLALQVRWCGQPAPATLIARASGEAVFSDGSQELILPVETTSGQFGLVVYPAVDAQPGQVYQLTIELAGQQLIRTGELAAALFLPVARR